MKKLASRIAAVSMAAVITLGFGSCGKKSASIASKEHIFTAEKIELPEGSIDYLNKLMYANDKLYAIGDKYTTEGEGENMTYKNETKLQIIGLDGKLENEIILVSDDGSGNGGKYFSSFCTNDDGSIYAIENYYKWDEATGQSEEKVYFVKFDANGKIVSETDLSKLSEEAKKASGNDYFYVDTFLPVGDGTILFSCNGSICGSDENGNFKYIIKNDNNSENSWMNGIYKGGDGRIYTYIGSGEMRGEEYVSNNTLRVIDTAGQKLGESYPFDQNGSVMNGTDKYDLLLTRDSGLFGYDVETGNAEPIIDWIKSGFDNTAMEGNCTTVLPDGRILCVTHDYKYNGGGGYSWGGNDLLVNILTEADPNSLPDRKLIKLYALYLDVGVKRQILEFNKSNPEYEIELTSYQDYAGNSYNDAITKLNNDMISGNLPDIIVLNSQMPIDSYISKGLLANIYDFMDKDETVNREDFLENLFTAYEKNGKLYELITNFSVNTIIGKTSDVGAEQGWTAEEFIQFVDAHPDKSVFGAEMNRSWFFSSMISASYGNFIDKETGKCSFDSDDFIKILEFANRFPKEIDYESLYEDQNYWQEEQAQYRNGKTLLNMTGVNRFGYMRELEKGQFGETVTFKGYPGAVGNGSSFAAETEIAITSKAANPDGAWNFVKYFLSEEYQDQFATNSSYTFPIRRSSLAKQAEAAKERPYWENEKGEKEYYDNEYWLGGSSVKIGVNTDEDNKKMMDFISSITTVSRYDENITKIINEETAAFFEGQKSAKDVADIIQNRVSNYIAENR